MRARVNRKQLQDVLVQLKPINHGAATWDMLNNVRFRVVGDKLFAASTDLAVSAEFELDAVGTEEGQVLTAAKPLLSTVRNLAGETIDIFHCGSFNDKGVGDSPLSLQHVNGSAKLTSENANEYPQLLEKEGAVKAYSSIPAVDLLQLLERTVYAVSTDDSRYTFTGARFEVDEGSFRMIATDGHRLALAESSAGHALEPDTMLVSLFTMKTIIRAIKKDSGDVDIVRTRVDKASSDFLQFKTSNAVIVSAESAGKFPDYKRVIPIDKGLNFTSNGEMLQAIKRVNSGRTRSSSPNVALEFADGILEIRTVGKAAAVASELLEVGGTVGSMTIGFNAHYLMDFLKTAKKQAVTWKLQESTMAALLETGPDHRMAIMPVRV